MGESYKLSQEARKEYLAKSDPKIIYLQPKCCAAYEGQLWCEDNVFDGSECDVCNGKSNATVYYRYDIVEDLLSAMKEAQEVMFNGIKEEGDSASIAWAILDVAITKAEGRS